MPLVLRTTLLATFESVVTLHNLDDDTDVTVAVSSSDTGEATVSPATLTFTEANWNTAQTVTVTGVNDDNADGHQDYDISLSELVVSSKALDFDGTNDYVDVGDFSLGGNLTFEAWMQYDSRATWSRVFDFSENGGADDNIWLGLESNSGKISFEVLLGSSKSRLSDGDGGQTAYGQVPINGTWIHVAATISGTAGSTNGTGKLYVNGNLVGSKTNMYVPAMKTRNKQYLGKSNWSGDSYLDAKMDEFRIWNYVRSQSEILATMNNTLTGSESGLVAYYKMNDGSGTSLADSSSNSNTATLNNMTDADWVVSGVGPAPESVDVALHNLDDDTDVTVAVSSSDTGEATVSPATLTFTEANRNTAQTVTVTGVNDNNADGNKAYKIILSSSGQDNATLSMSNLDDDFPATPQVTVNGLLSNSGTLSVQNSVFTLSSGASMSGGSLNVNGSTVVLSDNFTKTGGTVTANTATLKLNKSIILTSNNGLTFQDLDLNNSTLTLGSATTDLTVSNAVTLDNTSENINVGTADLTLSGGLTLTKGNIGIGGSSSGIGSIVLGNTSTIAADGTLDLGGALVLNAGLSVAGTLKTDNTTTLTLNNNALNLSGGSAASWRNFWK